MSNPLDLTLAAARDALNARTLSARELTEAYIDAMARARPLNIYCLETPEKALVMADQSDQRRRAAINSGAKAALSAMDGIPVAVKDLFCTAGVRTTASSEILGEFTPTYESTVTDRLWRAGAVMLGKASCDEFAMGSSNTTSRFGPVINPWQRRGDTTPLVPGGSSGGSAAAVAARTAAGALGTDTGGSIRQPAAFCGITGVKPTYGRCSRWGIVAFASSLDQAGPMARTVRDCALMLTVMCGYDAKDSTSADRPVPDFEAALDGDVKGMRIGIPKEYAAPGLNAAAKELWERGARSLSDAGAVLVDISLPYTQYALPAYYIIAPAEASSNLARYDGVRYGMRVGGANLTDMYEATRGAGFGAEVKRRILIGAYVLSAGYYDAYYLRAQKIRQLIAQDFAAAFAQVDAILTPSTPTPAFGIDEKQDDPLAMYLNDMFTVTANLAGLPAISVPAGLSADGLPLGLQLIGKWWEEGVMLRAAHVIEQAANFTAVPAFLR